MIDDAARPAVGHDELELRQALKHFAGQPGALLGDDDDVIVRELSGEMLRRNRFSVKDDLNVVSERGPVAKVLCASDVIV